MNEDLILQKLDSLSAEIQSLKAEISQSKAATVQTEPPASPQIEELAAIVASLKDNMDEMHQVQNSLKAGIELTQDLQPVAKQLLPKAITYLGEIDDQFSTDSLKVLITKALTSLDAMNEALDMLKAGMELRDDLIPIAKLSLPRVQKFLNALHEGEFQAEQLGNLLHTILLNIHTFSDLMNMISPLTELVKEFEVVMRQTDVLSNMNKWLDSLQQGNGAFKLAGTAMATMKQVNLSDEQIDRICHTLSEINLNNIEPVGPVSMISKLRDPDFQEAMGAMFMVMKTVGVCLRTCQEKNNT